MRDLVGKYLNLLGELFALKCIAAIIQQLADRIEKLAESIPT
jgi:hypothetical protein